MAADAPITQDLVTIPRKLPDGGKVNLVGLTRAAMRDALIAMGTPEKQAKMRVNQLWQWIYHWGVREFSAMTNLAKDYRAKLEEHFEITLPEIVSKNVSISCLASFWPLCFRSPPLRRKAGPPMWGRRPVRPVI